VWENVVRHNISEYFSSNGAATVRAAGALHLHDVLGDLGESPTSLARQGW